MEMIEIKERPILFTGEMVRAILDGRKKQTRRVLKPQPMDYYPSWYPNHTSPKRKHYAREKHWRAGGPVDFSPYGKPGDHLWVRETFWDAFKRMPEENGCVYKADYGYRIDLPEAQAEGQPWKPSIHMPRWASRITLAVTKVSVERVQDITKENIKAEGSKVTPWCCGEDGEFVGFQADFALLWDSINAKRGFSWGSNPWVWVVSFKRIPS